ncbi:glycosyltransferase family 9 protein [Proteus hauseri]|uniref:glycosyltransferase family 9 protein n=1 Tax=Proteus hauseri TaxID=183417 RepID=UPI0032DA8452
MFNTPAIRAIRAHYPDAHITLISSVKNKLLVENYDQIDSVIYWDNKIRNLLPVALQAKKYKPEVAVILHSHLPYDVLLAVMSSCQYILRNTFHVIPEWFKKWIVAEHQPPKCHVIQSKLNIIRYLGINSTDTRMEIPGEIKQLEKNQNSIVGFQMGASTQERRWPVKYFAELAQKLIDGDNLLQIKLIGSSRELELPEAFFVLLPEKYHNNIENLVGKTSLPDLLSHINIMDVLVTGDTGPLHLAITLQRPTVSLFATADPKWTGPYQDLHLHTIINKKPSPNEGIQASMDLITVDEVFNAVNKTLKD